MTGVGINRIPRRSYLLRVDEPYVMVPARVAALMETRAGVRRLRVQLRGLDPEASAVLEDIRYAALAWHGSAVGTDVYESPEPQPKSELVTPSQAADLIGITVRAIRKALTEGRLSGNKVGGVWQIRREDVEHYRAARAARTE